MMKSEAKPVSAVGTTPPLGEPVVQGRTAGAIRAASRADLRDADLAALVRSAAEPGLVARITGYRARQLARR